MGFKGLTLEEGAGNTYQHWFMNATRLSINILDLRADGQAERGSSPDGPGPRRRLGDPAACQSPADVERRQGICVTGESDAPPRIFEEAPSQRRLEARFHLSDSLRVHMMLKAWLAWTMLARPSTRSANATTAITERAA